MKHISSLFLIGALLASASCAENTSILLPNGKTPEETIGFTTAAGYYAFDDSLSSMEEGADRILEMGSKVVKLWLTANPQATYTYNTDWSRFRLDNCVDLLKSDYYRTVLGKDFSTIVLETHTYDATKPEFEVKWQDGMTEEEKTRVSDEMYEVAKYLMLTYNGTGKTFLLQNWEGDNMLGNEHWKYDKEKDMYRLETVPAEEADAETDNRIRTSIKGMTDWFNARQKGVDRARKELSQTVPDVQVLHVLEANFTRADAIDDYYENHPLLITPWVAEDTPMVIEKVVPYTDCDLYSLSCWGATSVARANTLQRRIEQYKSCIGDSWTDLDDNGQVKARRSMQRKGQVTKLMLGEYGSAERAQSGYMAWEYSPTLDDNIDTRHREVVQIQTDIAIKEGLEYILYWQVYCNDALMDIENPITRADAINGVHAVTRQLKGYWLIRPDGSYTEAYRYFRGLLDPSSLYFDGSLDKTAYSVDGAAGGVEISGMLTSQSPLSNMDEKKDYADMVSLYGSKDGKNFEEIPLTAFYTFAAPAGGGLESEVVFINSLPIDTDYRHFEIRKNENCPATLDRLKIYKPNPEDIK